MTAKWGEITAGDMVSPVQGKLIAGPPESVFLGLSTDSRNILPGQLFWALKGERYDGHDFLKQAVDKGAAGVVIEKDHQPEFPRGSDLVVITVSDTLEALGDLARWWRHQHPVQVVAITGSVGKTTTKEMAASILGLNTVTLKNKGNFNNLVGLPLTLFLLEEVHRRAVLEMGMNRFGEIARLTEIADPDVGLITNVGRAHLEGLGDIKGVARAKVEMVEKISDDSQAVLNGDDELLMSVASPFRKKVMTYGLGANNDIRAAKIQNLGREGLSFELQYFGQSQTVRLRVPGLQNVFNALGASAIAICLKESPVHIVKGLGGFEGIRGRFMIAPLPHGITLVDDTYNSNPSSLKAAIESVKELAKNGGRVIIGLGEMMELGDEAVPAHVEAGSMVAELGAHCFIAMGEHAPEMIEGAVNAGFPSERTVMVSTHEEMVQEIRDVMIDGDVILLKGSRRVHLEKVAESLKEKA
jgi:UDP-N-acetylmuramoyl-tripeptide--D-alanyl-D-alanine ligase